MLSILDDVTPTLDEKCEVIRDFGGVFFERVEECEYIVTDLEGGRRELFGRFEPLLRRMEDDGYAYNWNSVWRERRDDKLDGEHTHGDEESGSVDGRRRCVVS